MTQNTEKRRAQEAVAYAIATVALEGFTVSDATLTDMQAVVDGRMTIENFKEKTAAMLNR